MGYRVEPMNHSINRFFYTITTLRIIIAITSNITPIHPVHQCEIVIDNLVGWGIDGWMQGGVFGWMDTRVDV